MRVIMVTNTYPTKDKPYAGSAVRIQELGLRRLGIDISILFLERQRYGKRVYWGAHHLIKQEVKRWGADLVHVQFGGVQALQAVLAEKERTVLTFHGTDLHGGMPTSIKRHLRFKFGTWCSRWAARHAGRSIVVSPSLLFYLNHVTDRVSVITTGVDFEHFKPMAVEDARRKLELDVHKKYVLFCDSGHNPLKRRDLADDAVMYARKSISNLELLELHKVSYEYVPLYLNASDCLLITSDKEGSPNIAKEALACNIPIVSVEVGDVAARIGGVRNCKIVPRNVKEIGNALIETISTGGRTNGRDISRDSIENGAICRNILAVYKQVLNLNEVKLPDADMVSPFSTYGN
jgi:teichuronic acid biosynthesis glycosyltransferase TuaC